MVQTKKQPIQISKEQLRNMVAEAVKRKLRESYMSQDSTPEDVIAQIDKIVANGREFAFDMSDFVKDDEEYGYIYLGYDPQANVLYGGGATNAGIIRDFKMDYDLSEDLDSNLQAFYEQISEELMNQGYTERY